MSINKTTANTQTTVASPNTSAKTNMVKKQIAKAYTAVESAEKNFQKLYSRLHTLESERSAITKLYALYTGIVADQQEFGIHSVSNIHFSNAEATLIAKLIAKFKNDPNMKAKVIRETNKLPTNLLITDLSTPFSSGDINAIIKSISNVDVGGDIIEARSHVLKQLLEHSQAEYNQITNESSTKNTTKNLSAALEALNTARDNYEKISGDITMIHTGIMSETGGSAALSAFTKEFNLAETDHQKALNRAEAISMVQGLFQKVKKTLMGSIDSASQTSTSFQIDLQKLDYTALQAVDNYKLSSVGQSIALKYPSLTNLFNKQKNLKTKTTKMTVSDAKGIIGDLSVAVKELSEESSEVMIALSDASRKKNTAATALMNVVKNLLDNYRKAFGIQ